MRRDDASIGINRGTWMVVAAWLLSRGAMFAFLAPGTDAGAYLNDARQLLSANETAPLLRAYPPGALLLIAIPAFFAEAVHSYAVLFAFEMVLFDLLIVMALFAMAARTSRRDTAVERARVMWAPLAYVLLTSVLGTLILERYDLAVAALIILFLWSVLRGDRPRRSDLLAAVASSLALPSVLLVPPYLAYRFRTTLGAGATATTRSLMAWCSRGEGRQRLLWIAGGYTAIAAVVWALWPGVPLFNPIGAARNSGINPESLYATAVLWLGKVGALHASIDYFLGVPQVIGPAVATLLAGIPYVAAAVVIAGAAVVVRGSTRTWGQQPRTIEDGASGDGGRSSGWVLIEGCLAMTLLAVVVSADLNAHRLLWIAPIAALLVTAARPRARALFSSTLIVFVLTAFLWQGYYPELRDQRMFALALLFARNTCLALLLVDVFRCISERPAPALPAFARFWRRPLMLWMPLALVVAWVGVAALSKLTANDVWVQMRVGMDVLESRTMPRVDGYSAVAGGRPFIAYEWLSGVLWYVLSLRHDGAMLSILNSLVALAVAGLLLRALPRRLTLTSPLVAGILFLCMYLVLYRMVLRPHIFTILFEAMLVMLLEQWRRDGRIRPLLWLVPVQVLWVNLHGGYLFSVGLLLIYAAAATMLVLFPRMQFAESRRIALKDVGVLVGAACLCLLCSLANPYGYRILGLSTEIFFRSEYMKIVIYEWGSLFDGRDFVGLSGGNRPYFAMAWIALVLLLWILLLARNKRVSLFDWVQAGVATVLSVEARRFLSEFAILAFPILVRLAADSLGPASQKHAVRFLKPIVLTLTLVIASTARDGFAFTSQVHATPGLGFGGEQPYDEINELERLNAKGVILNDFPSGALIIYRLYPNVRPVVDSRIDIYSPESLAEYGQAIRDPAAFARYRDKYGINLVMLLRLPDQQPLIEWLAQQPDWKLQLVNERRVLFVRQDAIVLPR